MSTAAGDTFQDQQKASTKPPSRWLRKTRLCVYHLRNNCNRGNDCIFAHSLNDLQDGPNLYKTQLCADFVERGCNKPDCCYAHGAQELRPFPIMKQKLCKWHGTKGSKCRNGDACSFAHGTRDLISDIAEPEKAAVSLTSFLGRVTAAEPEPEPENRARHQEIPWNIPHLNSRLQNEPLTLTLEQLVQQASQKPQHIFERGVQDPFGWELGTAAPFTRNLASNKLPPGQSRCVGTFGELGQSMMLMTTTDWPYEEDDSDNISTSAETAGYLSE